MLMWRFAVHTGAQCPTTNPLQHRFRQNAFPQLRAAIQSRRTIACWLLVLVQRSLLADTWQLKLGVCASCSWGPQWEMHFAHASAALHFCSLNAPPYEEQTSIGATAGTQACCEPVLQSSTEQWEMYFAQTSAALHFCWLNAPPYEEQTSIGATAGTQACCEPVLLSSTDQ